MPSKTSPTKKREVELVLETHLSELGIESGDIFTEFKFDDVRAWRFDYFVEPFRLAIEIEGGIWTNGRHTRGRGYQDDLDKYNSAAVRGCTVFRFSIEDIMFGREIQTLRAFLKRIRGA